MHNYLVKILAELGYCLTIINAIAKEMEVMDDERSGLGECADNFRFALESNPEQMKAYEDAQCHGCCGYYDTTVEVDLGKDWEGNAQKEIVHVGWNYGH
jgi:hypothetical protein